MVYARTELVGNTQYYFYQRGTGDWEFTWDRWVNLARVDFNNFGACKFLIVFQRDNKKLRVQARNRPHLVEMELC